MGLQPDVITRVADQLRRSDGAAALHELVLSLTTSSTIAPRVTAYEPRAEHEELARDGYAFLPSLAGHELTTPLRETITKLAAAGLPAVFAFLRDEMWGVAELTRARLQELQGVSYRLLDDAWAWCIEPGRGRGWPPHRGGIGGRVFDRQRPELLTVWVALDDVAADQACMHVLPLDQDPGYPNDLGKLDGPLEAVRALPLEGGSALVWNANVLHWGGSCARARRPRVSCSFSFGRTDALPTLGCAILDPLPRTPEDRLAAIAGWIATYGVGQPDVAAEILTWARIHSSFREPAEPRKEP